MFVCAGSLLLHVVFLWLQRGRVFIVALGLLLAVTFLVVVPRFSRSATSGIFPDRGSNRRLLPWQEASLLMSHEGSPDCRILQATTAGYKIDERF